MISTQVTSLKNYTFVALFLSVEENISAPLIEAYTVVSQWQLEVSFGGALAENSFHSTSVIKFTNSLRITVRIQRCKWRLQLKVFMH